MEILGLILGEFWPCFPPMFEVLWKLLGYPLSLCQSKQELALENLALRHQIALLKRQTRKRRLRGADRLLWVALKRCWPNWKAVLMIFQPDTVIGWQRAGLRIFWRWKSRRRRCRRGKDQDLIQLIRRMWAVNPTWGSARIRGELAKLGLQASTATIRKYRPKSRRRPSQNWWTFLQNHAGAIAAMDFLVVPTASFRLLYVLVVLAHARRQVVHFNITEAPTAAWAAQQVVNAFPYDTAPEYLLRDRDSIYGSVFVQRVDGLNAGTAEDVSGQINAEATRSNRDPMGRSLPPASHWTTGSHKLSARWAPERQMELIEQGHFLLPWFAHLQSDLPP